ncbi:MAG: heavy metal translocating P-type ATPase [Myxococcota bacterium]
MSNETQHMESCPHCDLPVSSDLPTTPYCCRGCRMAHRLLRDGGLERFYDLRRGPGLPVGDAAEDASWSWLGGLLEQARATACGSACDGQLTLSVDVQGIHCAACVWLIETLFKRRPGAVHADVDPGLGRLEMTFREGEFPVREFLEELARCGYRTGPARKEGRAKGDDLLLRLGVVVAVAMNGMMLSLAGYFGMSESDGALYTTFTWVNAGLAAIAVAVGGPVFFRGAWQGLKRGVLHMDVPISLAILLAFGGSTWLLAAGRAEAAYFDTLDVFIALMLLGRWLQRRVIERNRRMLLRDAGIEGLRVRRLDDARHVHSVPVGDVREGDELLVAPGELVPVEGRLVEEGGDFSLAWITGEPDPVALGAGASVPAGAHHAGRRALRVRAEADFADSDLRRLLTPASERRDAAGDGFWHRLSSGWVLGVLTAAVIGFSAWLSAGWMPALEVAVAVLVITCPCAFGLATPLAREMAQARLRRLGLFVRRDAFLDRAWRVRKVLFDKTGTLTLGRLSVADPAALDDLDEPARVALAQMVARSNHPKSRAILEALEADEAPTLDPAAEVSEIPGTGMRLAGADGRWDLISAGEGDVRLLRDGAAVARVGFREVLRHDARREMDTLRRRGVEVHLLSGDDPERVAEVARTLGVDPDKVHGGLEPDHKARIVRDLDDEDTLVVGDGINDGPALDAAWCAGTPAVDRPTLPSRADFYLMTSGLGPISEALDTAATVRRVIRRNLTFAVVWNVTGVSLALAGLLSPLICAVAMPFSSLTLVTATAAALRPRPRASSATPEGPAVPRLELAEVPR